MADSSAPHSNGGAVAEEEDPAVPRPLAPPRRVALVTGITGQDGSYLTELLLSKGYEVAAHWYTVNYREAYGLFACNGVLFNHESPRRGENFVTRKITRAIGRIKVGLQTKVFLGNLSAARDWGFAGDYVEAMWLMLQQDKPDDYVVATEECHTVEEFLQAAFGYAGLNWKDHVVIDKKYFRPSEVDCLQGDSSKSRRVLGWKPKVGFQQLVEMMVDNDIELAKKEKVLVDAGYRDPKQQP
uniref:GDP-mannose 4,6-dehydratase n=1 Tax=Aegilops tauschii TaxID=37682 RepID=R7WDJ2_AEGTA